MDIVADQFRGRSGLIPDEPEAMQRLHVATQSKNRAVRNSRQTSSPAAILAGKSLR